MTNGLFGGCFGHFNMYHHLKQYTIKRVADIILYMYLSVVFLVYKVALRDALLPISKDKATHCELSFAILIYFVYLRR